MLKFIILLCLLFCKNFNTEDIKYTHKCVFSDNDSECNIDTVKHNDVISYECRNGENENKCFEYVIVNNKEVDRLKIIPWSFLLKSSQNGYIKFIKFAPIILDDVTFSCVCIINNAQKTKKVLTVKVKRTENDNSNVTGCDFVNNGYSVKTNSIKYLSDLNDSKVCNIEIQKKSHFFLICPKTYQIDPVDCLTTYYEYTNKEKIGKGNIAPQDIKRSSTNANIFNKDKLITDYSVLYTYIDTTNVALLMCRCVKIIDGKFDQYIMNLFINQPINQYINESNIKVRDDADYFNKTYGFLGEDVAHEGHLKDDKLTETTHKNDQDDIEKKAIEEKLNESLHTNNGKINKGDEEIVTENKQKPQNVVENEKYTISNNKPLNGNYHHHHTEYKENTHESYEYTIAEENKPGNNGDGNSKSIYIVFNINLLFYLYFIINLLPF